MIDAKSFMEFFEKECGVQFVDAETGRKTLDIMKESGRRTNNSYCDPAYQSDYDRFLEEERNDHVQA